jgi:RNA polymerase sigma-70 factor, ECF subfamily
MGSLIDTDLEQHRAYLMRYAQLQLRDQTLAEDVVQETLLAAIAGKKGFSGKSSYKTWLTGILKHKILDAMRRKSREQPLSADENESESDAVDAIFRNDGHWAQPPARWGDPEKSLENKKFWAIFERCSQLMPERNARVFMMREVMELSTEEICQELTITPTNLWVMLHRARLSLRECLDINWFGNPAK